MFDINEILRAQACDNLPREVCHEAQLANSALYQPEGRSEALQVDTANVGGDQADAVQPVGTCPACGLPIAEPESDGDIEKPWHRKCLPF